jgi:hypothetical protein
MLGQNCYTLWGDQKAVTAFKPLRSSTDDEMGTATGAHWSGCEPPINYLGTAMNIGDSLPGSLIRVLEQQLCTHNPRTNLLEYGCLPQLST